MKRSIAILALVALFALPVMASAQTSDKQGTSEAGRLAELLVQKGVITQQELAAVSTAIATAPAKGKSNQESDSSNPYMRDGLLW